MLARSSITINRTEYIPAKEAEVTFLIAILGIITGIVFGFLLLKYEFSNTYTPKGLPASVPASLNDAPAQIYPDGPNSPIENQNQDSTKKEDGLKEYSA